MCVARSERAEPEGSSDSSKQAGLGRTHAAARKPPLHLRAFVFALAWSAAGAAWSGCNEGEQVSQLDKPTAPVEGANDRDLYVAPAPPPSAAEPAIGSPAFDVSQFAAEREHEKGATLQTISIYGGPKVAGSGGQGVRVVLGFDGVAVFRRGELAAEPGLPRRVVIDIDGVRLRDGLHAALPVNVAGLSRIRAFALDAATTRVSFDIDDTAMYRLFLLTNPYRVILDFQPQLKTPHSASQVRTIVIDPGHGGVQDGAHGPGGLQEASVVLSLAQRVKRTLHNKLPDTNIVLTRDSDRYVSLEERSAIANGLDADLFVSIHLNAAASPIERGGVSTYVLDTSDDAQALRLAARENEAAEKDITDLQKLFASLYRKDQVSRSRELAESIQGSTLRWGRGILPELGDRGVKQALFYVLVGASMPAVLCEASFITDPKEAAALATEEYREALSEGIAEGIVAYVQKLGRKRSVGTP